MGAWLPTSILYTSFFVTVSLSGSGWVSYFNANSYKYLGCRLRVWVNCLNGATHIPMMEDFLPEALMSIYFCRIPHSRTTPLSDLDARDGPRPYEVFLIPEMIAPPAWLAWLVVFKSFSNTYHCLSYLVVTNPQPFKAFWKWDSFLATIQGL